MKVTVKDISGCSKEVHVEIPAETIQAKVDGIYQRIIQEAKLPGFRKGKAPMDVIKKQYKSAVREEMVRRELPEYFKTALLDEKIDPVSQPQVTHLQFEEGSPMKFIGMVDIKPKFELKNYKGFKITKEHTKVKEEDVDKALEGLREHLAQFNPVEDRPAREGDLVLIDFEGKIDGKTFEGGKANRYHVLLGSQNLLKDFETNLVGVKKGESKIFKITFPENYGKKELEGKEAEFTVTLHEIKEKKLPLVDNDFAKRTAKVGTVKELRERLEKEIKAHKEVEQRVKMVEQIGEKLIEGHPFDIPVSLVDLEQQRLVQQGVEKLRGQGIDAAKLSDAQKKQFVENLRPVAQKNVRMALLVEKIAETENIRCEEKDFVAYVDRLSKNTNQPPESVKQYIQKQGNLDSVRDWIRYEKTLDYLISVSKVETA